MRQDVPAVYFQRFFFVAAHQINVELRHADPSKSLKLRAMLLDRADQAESVDDFIGDEIGVVAADFAVMKIIVLTTILHEGSQRRQAILPVCI